MARVGSISTRPFIGIVGTLHSGWSGQNLAGLATIVTRQPVGDAGRWQGTSCAYGNLPVLGLEAGSAVC